MHQLKEIDMYGTAHPMATEYPRARDSLWDVHSQSAARTAPPEIGIADEQRQAVVGILNTVLADEFVLYMKTRRFHWNVEGPDFSELHDLFEKQYEQLAQVVDDVAERARALDGIPAGSLEEYLKLTRLKEEWTKIYDARGMIAALLADHESLIRNLRQDLRSCSVEHGDEGTMDFLTGIMQTHEKMAWMLRAYLR
jgi:starvation-inducible DNA-binding protein